MFVSVSIALWLHRGKDYYNPTNAEAMETHMRVVAGGDCVRCGSDRATLRGHRLTTCD